MRSLQPERKKLNMYKVIEEPRLQVLVEKVNQAIKEGWRPLGGISYQSANMWYLQALVRDR